MFSAHAIHVLLRNTLIFLTVIFIVLFFWLKVGIKTDSLIIGKYKIEKLYLKLDKKLTLKADKIVIPKNKSKPSFENIDKTFDEIKYLFTFFDEINLENVSFEDNQLHFIFIDNILYITSDDYEIAGNIYRIGTTLTADVSMLKLKKYHIKLKGNLSYNLKNHSLSTKGDFDAYEIKGSFVADKKGDDVAFKLLSNTFTNLNPIINSFSLDPVIKSWIIEKIKAKKYQLYSLEGQGKITEKGFKINYDSLHGKMRLDNVKVYYHKNLNPVMAKNIILKYQDKALYFYFENPTYVQRSLDGSTVSIVDLGTKNTQIKLDLHIQTALDDEIKKILKAYKIDIHVKHKGQPANAVINLKIPLNKSDRNEKVSVDVNVKLGEGTVWYKNIELPIKRAHITFENNQTKSLKINTVFQKGIVKIGKTLLPVLRGSGIYAHNTVTLKNVQLKESWYEGKVNGKIDLSKKHAVLQTRVKSLHIGDKQKFVMVKNKNLLLELDYKNNIRFNIPSMGVNIINTKKDMQIKVANLEKIKPYLKNIDIDFDGGMLDIIQEGDTYSFSGNLLREACLLYDKEGVCHTRIPFKAKLYKGNFDFYAFNNRVHYESKKSRIKLNNINIDLKKFLVARSKKYGQKSKKNKLVILGTNSKIHYGKYTLLTNSYDIEISPKGNIRASGSLNGDIVQFSKKGKIFTLKALRIRDAMLHPLIGFSGLKNGRYSLKMSGNPDKTMKGQIIIEGGEMKDFKAYNNALALINTLPALATLSNPGFSEKGFNIQEGVIEYRLKGKKVVFDSVYLKGVSATIVGKGTLNLEKKTIHMNLAIQTAREFGKVIGNLPLLGYILMGKDKSMTVGLQITGSLNKPKVITSAAEDILSLPLTIIKRTLESPAHIINK